MKRWYYIEDCTSRRSAVYDEILPAESKEDALRIAAGKWESLTDHDRRDRDEAFIGFADVDEDDCIDYNTMIDVVYLKKRK